MNIDRVIDVRPLSILSFKRVRRRGVLSEEPLWWNLHVPMFLKVYVLMRLCSNIRNYDVY